SGFLWRGKEFELLEKIRSRQAVLFMSPSAFAEFSRVLTYPRLKQPALSQLKLTQALTGLSVFVNPREAVKIVKEDPDDDKILELALAANADFIVSGDNHLLKLKKFNSIPILTTKEALALF
ncbi:putative toxin-antitoxin system toxin component, PIN family, partial [Candidatus Micrarchaeota archaeon]|nr:putative toxin-antitoxin system toxin component, PIN family [Candidatus Micrarchaeota archaeon]